MKKKPPQEKNIPAPLIALSSLIPIFLFGYLVLSILSEKTPKDQAPEVQDPLDSGFYGSPSTETASLQNSPQAASQVQPSSLQEMQFRDSVDASFERMTQDTKEQMQRLKTERDLEKIRVDKYGFQ